MSDFRWFTDDATEARRAANKQWLVAQNALNSYNRAHPDETEETEVWNDLNDAVNAALPGTTLFGRLGAVLWGYPERTWRKMINVIALRRSR